MKQLLCRFAAVFLVALLFTEARVSAATITVTNAAQFTSALSSVQPGDTILLSGTITSTSVFTTKKSGTSVAPITITGDGTAVIVGSNSGYGINVTNDYYRFSNFTIKNKAKGLVIGGTANGQSGNHGIVDNVHVMDVQQEAFKIKTGSKYWLFTNCSARRTGQQSSTPKYGEGFYVGQANSNWIDGVPDECAYITFYNCYTLDTYNDGWDMKEGSHHVKVINCTADFSGTVEPPLGDSVGDSGFYNRGDNCQYVKCAVNSLDNNAQGFDFGRYSTYGSNHEIKQSGVILGDASFAFILSTVTGVKIYSDYTFTSTGPFWQTGSLTVSFSDPAGFAENTWTGEGGELYGALNPSIGSNGDPLNPVSNISPNVSLTAPTNGASFTAPASIAMTANATDSDGTITTVGFYNGSTLLGSDTTSPYAFTWTNVAQGSYDLTARATDNSGAVSTSAVAAVTVNPNSAPVFTADPISKADATEAVAYTGQTLSGSATDADGDTLSYSAQAGPAWLSIATAGALSGTPATVDVGANSWQVQVSDGKGGTDIATLNITVNAAPVNQAPVFTVDPMSRADATADSAYTGQTLAGSATDPDAGATLTYSKVSGSAWLSVAADGALTGTPASTNVGANSWTVQVSDGLGGTDTAVLNITVVAAAANPPTFVAAGAIASGTGTITPALPAGLAAGDILLLFVETANQAVSISNTNGGTWVAVSASPQGTGTAGGTSATRLTAFWSRYNGTQGAPTVSDSGDHQNGRMIAIRGAAAAGDPWNVTGGGVESTSDTSGSIPGATTTVDNTLVVTAVAGSLPDATSTTKFSGWANANLTSLTERTDNSTTAGNGGALGVATGVKATAGAYGNTTVTHANAAVKGMLSIAIKN